MKNKYGRAGFTLIELLVVIAIIGILSSVVLVSLNIARSRGADSKVKSQLAGIKNAAQLYQDTWGDYVGVTAPWVNEDCETDDSMFEDEESGMLTYTTGTNYPVGTTLRCSSTNSTYVVSASLNTPGEFWCVDSSGNAMLITDADHETAHLADATVCTDSTP